VTDSERIIRELLQGSFRLTLHAQERMAERCVTVKDIQSCAKSGVVSAEADGKYKVKGTDLDGISLTLVCVWDGETLVITVF
jgi:hypothetical protein